MTIKTKKQKILITILVVLIVIIAGFITLQILVRYEFNSSVNKQVKLLTGNSSYTVTSVPLNGSTHTCTYVKSWLNLWHYSCDKDFNIYQNVPASKLVTNAQNAGLHFSPDGGNWYISTKNYFARCLVKIETNPNGYYLQCFKNVYY